jgi:hypothetical protein
MIRGAGHVIESTVISAYSDHWFGEINVDLLQLTLRTSITPLLIPHRKINWKCDCRQWTAIEILHRLEENSDAPNIAERDQTQSWGHHCFLQDDGVSQWLFIACNRISSLSSYGVSAVVWCSF